MASKYLNKYKTLLKSGEAFSFNVAVGRLQQKAFKAFDGDVTIVLSFEDYFRGEKLGGNELERRVVNKTGNPIEVVVTDIDEEKGIVTTSHSAIAQTIERKARAEIDAGIASGKPVIRRAKVFHMFGRGANSGAFVDLGAGLIGVIWVHDWSKEFTPDINIVANQGDMIDIAVIGPDDSETRADYKCSRALTMGDAWENIDQVYQKDDIVTVRCIDHWHEAFCGRLPNTPEINVKIRRPAKEKLEVLVGGLYVCKVQRVSKCNRKFEVWPIRQLVS